MKWIKCSEQMPPYPGSPQTHWRTDGHWKVNGNFYDDLERKEVVFGVHSNGAHMEYNIYKDQFDRIEWLDESQYADLLSEVTRLRGENEAMRKENEGLKKQWQDNPLTDAVYEGAKAWQDEYDNARGILRELVELKVVKNREGKSEEYQRRQPEAWKMAIEFLNKYQHNP